MNIADIVRVHARRMPDRPALVEGRETLDWASLQARIDAASWHLREQGVRRADVVAISSRSAISGVVLAMACARLGAAWCMLDWRASRTETLALVKTMEARLLIEDRPIAPPAGSSTAARAVATIDSMMPPGATAPEAVRDDTLTAALLQSGGTTGLPKIMHISHMAGAWRGFLRAQDCSLQPGTRVLNVVSPASAAGFGAMIAQLLAGAVTWFHPLISSPEELTERINALAIEQVTVVPTTIRGLLTLARGPGPLLPSLRALMTLGSVLHPEEKLETMAKLSPFLFDRYGFAGTGPVATATPGDLRDHPTSVGWPVLFVQLDIVDGAGHVVPAGAIGRIRVRSPAQASGYFGDSGQEERNETFADGYAFPGDLGRLDAEGRLHIEGRAATIIIRGGQNLYPEEIERVLLAHPDVAEAAVLGRADARLGEVPVALVVARNSLRAIDLEGHCRSALHPAKVPAEFRFVDQLPKTDGGKIRRAGLGELLDPPVRQA